MSINYSYEIIRIDDPARCMEVLYSAEGYGSILVGVRTPDEGETLEQVIDAFSPVPRWMAQTPELFVVQTEPHVLTLDMNPAE